MKYKTEKYKALKTIKAGTIAIFLIAFSVSMAKTQEVIATGGSYHESSNASIGWTLGETLTETFQVDETQLTQGFHQSKITVVSVDEVIQTDYNIKAFPNPTDAFVTLSLETENYENIHFRIFDANGRFVKDDQINAPKTTVSFEGLMPGIYFIKIIEYDKELQTIRIIKN